LFGHFAGANKMVVRVISRLLARRYGALNGLFEAPLELMRFRFKLKFASELQHIFTVNHCRAPASTLWVPTGAISVLFVCYLLAE
jgi:hypothetical protein